MRRASTIFGAWALGALVAGAWAPAAGQDRTNQDLCYQRALARQGPRAEGFDWSRTPAREKLALIDAALAESPRCAYLHYLRGLVLDAEMGLPGQALGAFEKAVDMVTTFDLAHENIALVHWSEARRSFDQPALRPDTRDDVFRLTRALAALKRAADVVSGNRLWGPQRSEHLLGLIGDLERELAELTSPEGNSDFLDGELTELVVTGWRANVRSGFGLGYPVRETLKRGDRLEAAADHRLYGWIKVRLPDGGPGWVYHNLVR